MAQLNAFPGWRQLSAAIIALVVSFAAFVPSAATAQTEAEAAASQANIAIEARREALFAAMLNDPTNLDLAFEYAQLSAQVGDVEAAISTLERMLIYAPNLPRLQLELGVLYYRIGAIDIARSYLEAASRENTPQVVQDRVDVFLAQIGRQDQRLVVSGSLHGGIRYQSNATAAPDQDII
ncbi:MAG: tetratricopeptide repeat protein, partial [Pseudomonadota bacterium]